MVKKISLSLFLFISGCGFYSVQSTYIHPVFVEYVNRYKEDKYRFLKTKSIEKLSIVFGYVNAQGVCSKTEFKNQLTGKSITVYREIIINPEVWEYSSDTHKEMLIYHELGHCDLDFEHTVDQTLMNTYLIDEGDYLFNRDYYLGLFFKRGK